MSWKRKNPEIRLKPLFNVLPKSIERELWLDVGSGDGFFSNLMGTLYPNNTILRSDISAHAKYGDLGLKSYMENLGIRPRSLSGIICSQVLHYQHSNKQKTILDFLNRFLMIDGILLIIEYDISRSYSWIPHPIGLQHLINYAQISTIWSYSDSTKIRDGNRPKYSILLKKIETGGEVNLMN